MSSKFEHVDFDTGQVEKSNLVRGSAIDLADAIEDVLPPGRERSLAMTKLEECLMWVNRGIALGPANG